MNETQLKNKVKDHAKSKGVFCIKVAGGPRQRVGISDLLMVVPPRGRLLAMELKAPGHLKEVTPAQIHFLGQVTAMGAIAVAVDDEEQAKRVIDTMITAEMSSFILAQSEPGPQSSGVVRPT